MKKGYVWLIMGLVLFMMIGCDKREEVPQNVEPQSEQMVALSEEELAYFNGTEFFNDYENRRNQFLSSLYTTPEDIDLFELLYCGTGVVEPETEEERRAVWQAIGAAEEIPFEEIPCACEKQSVCNIDEFLLKNMGLTLSETNKVGLDQFTYLEAYDAYYHIHGDTNYRMEVVFHNGERQGDRIRLYYTDEFFHDGGEKVVTLQKHGTDYLIVSNELVSL